MPTQSLAQELYFVPIFAYLLTGETINFIGFLGIVITVLGVVAFGEFGSPKSIPLKHLLLAMTVPLLFAFQLPIDRMGIKYTTSVPLKSSRIHLVN